MESKADYIRKLKSELSQVGSEIEKLIVRTDKMSVEIKHSYDDLETALLAKQSATQAKLSETSMSGDLVWDLVWGNVWDAVKELNRTTTSEIEQDYKGLEPALQAKQSALKEKLAESLMSGDEVWHEIWYEVWYEVGGVVDRINAKTSMEIKQDGAKLEALALRQSALQEKLHELLMSNDEAWNVTKEFTHAIVE